MGDHKRNPVAKAVAAGLAVEPDQPPVEGARQGLQIQVGVEAGLVAVRFDQPIAYFAMPPAEAARLAQVIMAHAHQAAKVSAVTERKLIVPSHLLNH